MVATAVSGAIVAYFEDQSLAISSANGASALIVDLFVDCYHHATDGRINAADQQMLAAIYHASDAGYDIWAIDASTSTGRFDYNVTRDAVDAALANVVGDGLVLIASGATSELYAAANGQCILVSPNAGGEAQHFTFNCAA